MAEPFGFGFNNNFGDLNNLSGDESEDENREDEIKQLLEEAFNIESFDDESEHSFAFSENSQQRDLTTNDNDSSMHSYNENSENSNIGVLENKNSDFSFLNNGHTTVLPNISQPLNGLNQFTNGRALGNSVESAQPVQQIVPNTSLDRNGGGGDNVPTEIEENNKTVSIIHKTHCPQITNGGGGDTNGNDDNHDNWTSTPVNKVEQLQTLNSYRERQIVRFEETIESLSKDKRALNHKIGLMRTEVVQMQSSYTDLEKALKLKEEEIEFLKSKIQGAIVDFEGLKKSEKDVKDENNRLVSHIGKLEQQVKLLSTIGSSTQQAEVDTIVRQIRDRHAQEIISYKTEVSNLEAELRSYKRQINGPKESESISTQTFAVERENEHDATTPMRTSCTQTINFDGEMLAKTTALKISSSTQTMVPKVMSAVTQTQPKLTSTFVQTDALKNEKVDSPKQTEAVATQTFRPSTQTSTTQTVPRLGQNSTQANPETLEKSASMNTSTTTEVQTDETLQTYEVLNSLFEKWATEASDATKRAELAESQVQFTEVSLKKLRKKFKSLYNMTSVCRKEWKKQEEFLKQRNEETKSRYLNLLINLHQKFESLNLE